MLESLLLQLQQKSQTVEQLASLLASNQQLILEAISELESRGVTFKHAADGSISIHPRLHFLSKQVVESVISNRLRQQLHVECHFEVKSTNQILLNNIPYPHKLCICCSEWQSEGRGRQRNPWISPLAHNLLFSIGRCWQLQTALIEAGILSIMSLLAGVAVATTLKRLGLGQIKLKWPNDIVVLTEASQLNKIGGILVEVKGNQQQGTWVTGIGLNVGEVGGWQQQVDQQITSISQITQGDFSREVLLAGIIESWLELEHKLLSSGVKEILKQWQHFDVLYNQPVTIYPNQGVPYDAIARGIDKLGQLQIEPQQKSATTSKLHCINSGDVKVRMMDAPIN